MKKVIIIGCPGSGKSTLARALHQKTGLPLYHLDMMYWNADKTTVEKSVFRKRLSAVLEEAAWIVDGNYSSTMEMRLQACDTVIFLDFPLDVCLAGIKERRGKPRSDMPWVETEEDEEFVEFIKSYQEMQRPLVLALLDRYPDKMVVVLTSREQADACLSGEFWKEL